MPRRARDSSPAVELKLLLERCLNDETLAQAMDLIDAMSGTAQDEPADFPGKPRTGAMDSRMAYDMSSAHPGRIVADRERAIAEVEGVVGRHTVMACDSAASVFRTALKAIGVSAGNVHETGLKPMWDLAKRRGDDQANSGYLANGGSVAQETRPVASSADFLRRNPGAARIRTV